MVDCVIPNQQLTWPHVVLALIAAGQTVALAWVSRRGTREHRAVMRALNGAEGAENP